MRAQLSKPILLTLALAACSPGQDVASVIANHDPSSQDAIVGIERLGEGPYRAGQTEYFRAVVDDDVIDYRWEASGGDLAPAGAEVTWTLPEERRAWLKLVVTLPDGQERASDFMFFSTAAGDIDTSSDTTGTYCDLTFDATDKPHLIYSNDTHPSIWYATYQNGAWITEFVDGMGFDTGGQVQGNMSIAVDTNNRPHLAYIININGDEQVYYAHKTASGWIRERVDTSVNFYSPQNNVAIALDPVNGQRPTIVYTSYAGAPIYNYGVTIAYRTGTNTWVNERSLDNDHYFAGSLEFDSSGVAHFAVRNYNSNSGDGSTNQYIRHGTWPPYSESAELENSYSLENARLALDATDQPIIVYRGGMAHKVGNAWIYSEIESFNIAYFDIAFDGVRPHVALLHGYNLELVTTDAEGYWQYTDVGTVNTSTPNIAIDATGQPHACFQQNYAIAFQ